ncbi:hypothetical protein BWI15_14270 [Kribbella sp. ALI-6-A]|nr:hypothetical protein BWI15_14270 [Kribbella sp. ALI-6-A]
MRPDADLTAQHTGLLGLLQEPGEDAIDVEGLGVARHALREAAEQRDVLGVRTGLLVEQSDQTLAEAGEREWVEARAVPVERDRHQEAALDQLGLQCAETRLGGQWTLQPLPGGTAYRWGEADAVDQSSAAQQHRGERVGHRTSQGGRESSARGGERTRYLAWRRRRKHAQEPPLAERTLPPGTDSFRNAVQQLPVRIRTPGNRGSRTPGSDLDPDRKSFDTRVGAAPPRPRCRRIPG